MWSSQPPTALLALLVGILSSSHNVEAMPLDFHDIGFTWLHERGGDGNCGADLQYTCSDGQICATTMNAAGYDIAFCADGAPTGDGGDSYTYAVYTTTYTETDLILRTSTWTSSWQPAAPTAEPTATGDNSGPAVCTASLGQQSCGVICCASDQGCAGSGWCTPAATPWSPTTTGSPPTRPTGPTTTQTFVSPATASGSTLPIRNHSSSGGLSGGAIAGIVIGVLAGIIILALICFCCVIRAGFHGALALLGLGSKKRKSTERTETIEHHSRHGSGTASRRDTHKGWFGASSRPSRPEKKKSSGFGGVGAVGAGLLGLAVILGLKRKHDKKKVEKRPVSDISSSYYTDSYTGTSASSASSDDRRTRNSRRH